LATTYVLDSNVLLSDPEAIHAFPGAGVVIPGVVIEEIDAKKYGLDGTAYNARQVARQLDLLRSGRSLKEPVPLDNGSTLRVELNHRSLDCLRDHFPEVNNDNRLLAVALNLHREAQARDPHGRVVLVSQDAIVRIKADALGLNAEDYLAPENRITAGIYTGYEEVEVDPGLVDRFYLSRQLPLAEIPRQLQPHQYVILKSYGSSQSAIGRCDSEGQVLLPLNLSGNNIWGISPRNVQQKMALDLLLDSSIPQQYPPGDHHRPRRYRQNPSRPGRRPAPDPGRGGLPETAHRPACRPPGPRHRLSPGNQRRKAASLDAAHLR